MYMMNIHIGLLMQKLFRMTSLEDSFGCNFNVLINARPIVLGVKEIIANWVDFRIGCIERSLRYDLAKKKEKLHLLEALKKILLDTDIGSDIDDAIYLAYLLKEPQCELLGITTVCGESEKIRAYPHEVTLIAIGNLTNIALLLTD